MKISTNVQSLLKGPRTIDQVDSISWNTTLLGQIPNVATCYNLLEIYHVLISLWYWTQLKKDKVLWSGQKGMVTMLCGHMLLCMVSHL